MIHVLAFITAHPGQRATVLSLFQANVAVVRAEDGCLEYNPAIDLEGSSPSYGDDTFVVIEKWQSLAHLKAHGVAPHMVAFGVQTKQLVKSVAVHVLTPVA